jgi:hypothetical protein
MSRIARTLAMALLAAALLSSSGCIHTWTGTYAEYPPSMYDDYPAPPQGQPSDG